MSDERRVRSGERRAERREQRAESREKRAERRKKELMEEQARMEWKEKLSQKNKKKTPSSLAQKLTVERSATSFAMMNWISTLQCGRISSSLKTPPFFMK